MLNDAHNVSISVVGCFRERTLRRSEVVVHDEGDTIGEATLFGGTCADDVPMLGKVQAPRHESFIGEVFSGIEDLVDLKPGERRVRPVRTGKVMVGRVDNTNLSVDVPVVVHAEVGIGKVPDGLHVGLGKFVGPFSMGSERAIVGLCKKDLEGSSLGMRVDGSIDNGANDVLVWGSGQTGHLLVSLGGVLGTARLYLLGRFAVFISHGGGRCAVGDRSEVVR